MDNIVAEKTIANLTLADDVAAVAKINIVPLILDVVCRTTGLGVSAVARVTEDRWVACAVRDDIAFGLKPGGVQRKQEGLGLGLYIAARIAEAHGGGLDVSSSPEETRFTFRMPA